MLYFFMDTYSNHIIFFFSLYCFLILIYPISKLTLNTKNIIFLNIASLSALIWNYFLEAYSIFLLNSTINIDFTSFTLFANLLDYSISFSLTPISFAFSMLVLLIGFCTNIYILNYFKGEADEGGFVFWINGFIGSMLILVLANNFFTLFLGWELIGFTSFFLINFWQSKRSTLKSSFKAFSFNLVSDLFLLGALVIFYQVTSTSDIPTFLYLMQWGGYHSDELINFALLLLLGCASIKSVQLFGHLWLPDSMEAPVPASALIHSATLVSAGIYLLARFNVLLVLYGWMPIITTLGAITASYGGLVAASQTDMKKLLAYSTMSHCGFLMILVSFSNFYVLVIYLFLHGFYKAATFFCAGSFIRIFGSQDTRVMGRGNRMFFGDTILLIICAGNLCGLPLTIGVLYKSFFLQLLVFQNVTLPVLGFLLIGMLTGVVYFYRLVFYSIFDVTKWTNVGTYTSLELVEVKIRHYKWFVNRNHIIATLLILCCSLYMYIIFLWCMYTNTIEYEVNIFMKFLPTYLINSLNHIYITYFLYFYFIYLVLVVLIIFITWRYQYIWALKYKVFMWGASIIFIGEVVALLLN